MTDEVTIELMLLESGGVLTPPLEQLDSDQVKSARRRLLREEYISQGRTITYIDGSKGTPYSITPIGRERLLELRAKKKN